MNRALAAVALLCCVTCALPARADDDQVLVDRGRIEGVLGHALQALARDEGLADGCGTRACRKVARSLRRLEASLRSLHDEVAAAPDQDRPVVPPPAPRIQAIAPGRLQGILQAMDHEAFPQGKLRVLGDAAGWAYFTANQVTGILHHLTFGSDKLKALRILAPRLIDPEDGYRIYGAFTFDSNKQVAHRILAGVSH